MSTSTANGRIAPVAMTGAMGFLGWHTRAALHANGIHSIPIAVGAQFDVNVSAAALEGARRLIHIAGVNRASDDEVRHGNVMFASQMVEALRRAQNPPRVVVFANSTQAGNGSIYGTSKEVAAGILAEASKDLGLEFLDVKLPNLFGEHGKPFYNAVTSTFSHLLARGDRPQVVDDKELTLLHAQNAADLLTGEASTTSQTEMERRILVSELLGLLAHFADTYSSGQIPDMSEPFARDLFNTYRSYAFQVRPKIRLTKNADRRGSFFEIVRAAGGETQCSFSTTNPGISRGDHFHRRKIERFTVLAGEATIAVRRLFTDEVLRFRVSGESPTSIDMPTLWSHRITNTGSGTLFTSFWTNELYDAKRPDTVLEVV